MKNLIKIFTFLLLMAGTFLSCKKDENKIFLVEGTSPVLTASNTAIPLSFVNKDNEAISFNWTNPEYKFTTGTNSQDVTYLFEMDTTGANFTNPKRKQLSINKELSRSFTQSEINDFLLNQLELAPAMPHNIEIRVKASLAGSANTEVFSNVLAYTVTPYTIPPKVNPPASGTLFITGNAVPSDWTNSPPASQKFTKVSNTFYTIIVPLIGGNSYIFLSTFGSWDDKYSIAVKNDPALVNGGDFQWQGNDILAPAVGGNYKIDVNFQTGKFALTRQ